MSSKYKLLVGLGNPGKKYEKTRHNAGFLVLDEIWKKGEFSEFSFNKKFNAEVAFSENEGSSRFILMKPQTFMNLSGESVLSVMNFYKIFPKDIVVFHDDLDIILGKYKLSENSRAAGHNGVADIINRIGTQEFLRVRIGVENKEGRDARKIPGRDFVLRDFSDEEMNEIRNVSDNVCLDLDI